MIYICLLAGLRLQKNKKWVNKVEYLLLYFISYDEEELYVTLENNDNFPAIYKNSEWKFCNVSFNEIKKNKKLKKISFEESLGYTFGLNPKEFYLNNNIDVYNKISKVNKEYDQDFLKKFLNEYKEFAIDDLINHFHNKDNSLTYSAKELDVHYENCGTYEFLDEHFSEFLKRKEKGEFDFVDIMKTSDDYIMCFKINNDK